MRDILKTAVTYKLQHFPLPNRESPVAKAKKVVLNKKGEKPLQRSKTIEKPVHGNQPGHFKEVLVLQGRAEQAVRTVHGDRDGPLVQQRIFLRRAACDEHVDCCLICEAHRVFPNQSMNLYTLITSVSSPCPKISE